MKVEQPITSFFDFTFIAIILLLLVLMLASGCKHEPIVQPIIDQNSSDDGNGSGNGGIVYEEITCDPDTAYFVNDILPIFISNCAKSGCHDASSHEDGIILDSYANIMSTGDIEPGDPSADDIVEVISETDPDKVMPPPPGNHLSSDLINRIIKWINQGALNNSCSGHCDTTLVTFSGNVFPLLQTRCVGCHNNTSSSGNVNLSNYNVVKTVALNGKLIHIINHDPGYSPMPKGGSKMPQCEIDQIKIWVDGGAPNN